MNNAMKQRENNRMGKTRNLKKIGDIKGTFQSRIGMIKNINSKPLSEEIKKRRQEYTEELQGFNDPDNHNVMVTRLEPDILEYEVKWALGSITMNKACGGDRCPADLFKILKDNTVKVLHWICQQIWKTQQWPQD